MTYDQVQQIEIDLTSFCNLKCKLCAHNYPEAQHIIKPFCRPLNEWIQQLTKYQNLKEVIFAGILSEPTLYPDFLELIEFCVKRNFSVSIYTNGNTHDLVWWRKLGQILRKCDKVVFTICGSTQELHEKYRVGSNLQQILDNASAFRNENKNDVLQHIKFQYNEDDLKHNMMKIFKMFSKYDAIETLPYNERFCVLPESTDIQLPKRKSNLYKKIMKKAKHEYHQLPKNHIIDCVSLRYKFLAIDNYGNEYPCFLWRLYSNDTFNILNYSDIVKYKYSFCYECEKHTQKMLNLIGIEPVA